MPGPLSKVQITMSDQTRVQIQSWLRCPTMPSGLVRRARAVLLLEQGGRYAPTARQVGLSKFHLRKWARRFREHGGSRFARAASFWPASCLCAPGRTVCGQAGL